MALTFDSSMLELDEGLLNDVIIHFETIEDTFEKAIARYDYPYADGADLEDMGQKAHIIKFRCYFWDDAEQQSYASHTLLIDGLAQKELLDFVHPKYGLIKGKIESIVILHDDSAGKAAVDVTFVEQMRGSNGVITGASPDGVPIIADVIAGAENAYVAAQAQQSAALQAGLKSTVPQRDIGALGKTLDAHKGLLEQVQEYSRELRAIVGRIEGYLAAAEAVAHQVVSPINSLQATLIYTANLPGRIAGALARSLERVALLHVSLKRNSGGAYLQALDNSYQKMENTFRTLGASGTAAVPANARRHDIDFAETTAAGLDNIFRGMEIAFRRHVPVADASAADRAARDIMLVQLQISCACRLALEATDIYAADGEAANPMNIRELEETLHAVRRRIDAAMNVAREMQGLKEMAAIVLNYVNRVRLEREKMIAVRLDNPAPLHLVCLKYGLPYRDAERLIGVNNIRQPNFTSGEVTVYVR